MNGFKFKTHDKVIYKNIKCVVLRGYINHLKFMNCYDLGNFTIGESNKLLPLYINISESEIKLDYSDFYYTGIVGAFL